MIPKTLTSTEAQRLLDRSKAWLCGPEWLTRLRGTYRWNERYALADAAQGRISHKQAWPCLIMALLSLALALSLESQAAPKRVPPPQSPVPSGEVEMLLCQRYGDFMAEVAQQRLAGLPLVEALLRAVRWDAQHRNNEDIQRIHIEAILSVYNVSVIKPAMWWKSAVEACLKTGMARRLLPTLQQKDQQ